MLVVNRSSVFSNTTMLASMSVRIRSAVSYTPTLVVPGVGIVDRFEFIDVQHQHGQWVFILLCGLDIAEGAIHKRALGLAFGSWDRGMPC